MLYYLLNYWSRDCVLASTWHCEHRHYLPQADTNTVKIVLITTREIPWCRLETPDKVVELVFTLLFPTIFALSTDRSMSAYAFRQSDLPNLDFNIDRGTDFMAWRMQWESYCFLSRLLEEDAAKQVKALTLCLSRETLVIVHNLGLSEAEMKRPQDIIDALQPRYVDGHINKTVERRNFRHRNQQRGETFDDYLISLRDLAKTCRFCSDIACRKTSEIRLSKACLMGTQ